MSRKYVWALAILALPLMGFLGCNGDNGGQATPTSTLNVQDLDTPPQPFDNDGQPPVATPGDQPGDMPTSEGAEQVAGIPGYPKSEVKSYYQEEGQESASFIAPPGVSVEMIFDYYADSLPALGWTKIDQDADRSVTYENASGRKAEIWIYYDNPEEGVDYVIESPPFTGHPQ